MARRPRPKVVRLKAPDGDEAMARTLLWMLKHVRSGKIKGFCLVGIVEGEAGRTTFAGSSADGDRGVELELLGAMRMEEHNLIMRRREDEE